MLQAQGHGGKLAFVASAVHRPPPVVHGGMAAHRSRNGLGRGTGPGPTGCSPNSTAPRMTAVPGRVGWTAGTPNSAAVAASRSRTYADSEKPPATMQRTGMGMPASFMPWSAPLVASTSWSTCRHKQRPPHHHRHHQQQVRRHADAVPTPCCATEPGERTVGRKSSQWHVRHGTHRIFDLLLYVRSARAGTQAGEAVLAGGSRTRATACNASVRLISLYVSKSGIGGLPHFTCDLL